MNSKKNASGFTLVELAIVLVIIGLIVGGVLVGQDLIKAATIRAGVTQIEQYDTAVNTFHSKFNGIPGDLANPATYFPSLATNYTPTVGGTGDGDGQVDSINAVGTKCTDLVGTCFAGENVAFWYELSQAGFIPNAIDAPADGQVLTTAIKDSTIPAFKTGKGSRVAIQGMNGRNYWVIANFGSGAVSSGVGTWTAGITPSDALQIDTKVDDGAPGTGKAISIAVGTLIPVTAANIETTVATASTTNCGVTPSTGTTAYNAVVGQPEIDELLCSMSIRASF